MHNNITTKETTAEIGVGGKPPTQEELKAWLGFPESITFKDRLEKLMTQHRTPPYSNKQLAKKMKPNGSTALSSTNKESQQRTTEQEKMEYTEDTTTTHQNDDDEQHKTAPTTTSWVETSQYNVPTDNRFGLLTTEEIQQDNANMKNNKMPPIIVTARIVDFGAFHNSINNIAKQKYSIRYFKKSINIYTTNKDDFNNINNELKKNKVESYSFTPKDEQMNKYVLKAAPGMEVNSIKRKLEENNIKIANCVQMTSKKTGQLSHSYLIYTEKSNKIKTMKNVTDINNIKTKWEHFVKPNKITQCYRCQRFGHGSKNCNYRPRCLKCIGDHETKDCSIKKTENSIVQCCNCKGPHTANYQGCPARVSFENEKRKSNSVVTKKPVNTNPFTIVDNAFPQLSNNNNTNHTTIPKTPNNRNYAQAARATNSNSDSSQFNEFQNLLLELHDLNNTCNINYLIDLVRNLKNDLQKCSNDLQRLTIMQRLLNNE